MSRIIISLFTILVFFQEKKGVDFLNYHHNFVEIERLIANENFIDAQTELENLLIKYEPSFTKDYVILAQLCLLNNDKLNSILWLKESMKYGAKLDCLRDIELLNTKITFNEWRKIETEAEKLTKIYHSKINYSLGARLNRNYQNEQDSKTKKNYKSVVYSNYSKIQSLLNQGTFPGEYLIGIDNSDFAPKITECSFGNAKVIVTLLHFDYPITGLTETKLVSAIKKGQLHPREFASIYTFEKNRYTRLYKQSHKNGQKSSNYNFLFPFEQRSAQIDQVNADRKKFGICSVETDAKKNKVEEKYGMKLKFGYK